MKGMIVVRIDRCVGCKSCELACAVEHSKSKQLFSAVKESPPPRSRVTVEQGEEFAVPLQCRQCDDAPCVKVCPTGALFRPDDDSPVIIEQEMCIGCLWCVQACPFGVIAVDSKNRTVIKCDQCIERLRRGEKPACVSACPTNALAMESQARLAAAKRRAALLRIERGAEAAERLADSGE